MEKVKYAKFSQAGSVYGNDIFAAQANLSTVSRSMFSAEGIDLKAVKWCWARVQLSDEQPNPTGLSRWDVFVEVKYTTGGGDG